jgi:hypothetical protein
LARTRKSIMLTPGDRRQAVTAMGLLLISSLPDPDISNEPALPTVQLAAMPSAHWRHRLAACSCTVARQQSPYAVISDTDTCLATTEDTWTKKTWTCVSCAQRRGLPSLHVRCLPSVWQQPTLHELNVTQYNIM